MDLQLIWGFSQRVKNEGYRSNDFERIKHVKTGNALIFCRNKKTIDHVISNDRILDNTKKITLNLSPCIILKNINLDEANSISEELENAGITKVKAIGKDKKVTKATCKDDLTMYQLLKENITLQFGRRVFTELFMTNIVQCSKCKKFGHVISKCPNEKTCKDCGDSHEDDEKCKKIKVCANWG